MPLGGVQTGEISLKRNKYQEPLKGHTSQSSNSASQTGKEENKQKCRDLCTRMFIPALFIVTRVDNFTIDEGGWGLQYIHPLKAVFAKGT